MEHARRVIQLRSYALAFAVALSPAFFQTSYSCARGNTFLLSLEVEVSGQDQIVNFSTTTRSYVIAIDTSTAVLSVVTQDPASNATYRWFAGGTAIGPALPIGVGGGEVTVNVPNGQSELYVNVQAPEGAFDSYVVDVDRTDPCATEPDGTLCDNGSGNLDVCSGGVCVSNAVTQSIPMYCNENIILGVIGGPGTFQLTMDPLQHVTAGSSFDAEISGIANVTELATVAPGIIEVVLTRIAIGETNISVLPRSGATGSVPLEVSTPTTCAVDANGNRGLGAGPFPTCDPANNTGPAPVGFDGGFANADCTGLGGAPSSENPCLPFRDLTIIDGTADACAACIALDVAGGTGLSSRGAVCQMYGFCSVLDDHAFPLAPQTASFLADPGATEALFGFAESIANPPPAGSFPDGFTMWWEYEGGLGATPTGGRGFRWECFMGQIDQIGGSLTPAPDSALVSIPVSTNWCATTPIDCSGSTECLTDGVCDPACEAGTGCNRCPGQDQLIADGTACSAGSGTCQSGVCEPNPTPEWGEMERFPSGGRAYNDCSCLVVDNVGNVTAVCSTRAAGVQSGAVYATRYTPGVGWSTPVTLSESGIALRADCAIDPNGNVTAVWDQKEGTTSAFPTYIWSARYEPTSGWGDPAPINPLALSSAWGAQVAVDPAGNATAVWGQGSGDYNFWSSRYTTSGGWGVPEPVAATQIASNQGLPQVGVDDSGNVTAVWACCDSLIVANRYTPGVGWGTLSTLLSNLLGDVHSPQVAVAANGNATAVWRQYVNDNATLWASSYTPGGGWDLPGTIGLGGSSPDVAVDSNGNATAVWSASGATWASRYTVGGGWSLVDTIGGSSQSPRVVIGPGGDVTVVWRYSGPLSNRFTSGAWGTVESIGFAASGTVSPHVVDFAGNVTVVQSVIGGVTGQYSNPWFNRFE
jgi:hypothetical protein